MFRTCGTSLRLSQKSYSHITSWYFFFQFLSHLKSKKKFQFFFLPQKSLVFITPRLYSIHTSTARERAQKQDAHHDFMYKKKHKNKIHQHQIIIHGEQLFLIEFYFRTDLVFSSTFFFSHYRFFSMSWAFFFSKIEYPSKSSLSYFNNWNALIHTYVVCICVCARPLLPTSLCRARRRRTKKINFHFLCVHTKKAHTLPLTFHIFSPFLTRFSLCVSFVVECQIFFIRSSILYLHKVMDKCYLNETNN